MNIIKLKKRIPKFIEYFIKKEKDFLYIMNPESYDNKNFKFYMEWFSYALDDYMKNEYDIEKFFAKMFSNNYSLDITFSIYIMSKEFRERVMNCIIDYKSKYQKEHIY